MGEPDVRETAAPFNRSDYETMYWAMLDFLTLPDQPDQKRRAELRTLVMRLSEYVRYLRSSAGSGVRKRVNIRDAVRDRLLSLRNPSEEAVWSIYGEVPDEQGDLILLTVTGGRYDAVVERSLDLPEFITRGMGGQIDRLGE